MAMASFPVALLLKAGNRNSPRHGARVLTMTSWMPKELKPVTVPGSADLDLQGSHSTLERQP